MGDRKLAHERLLEFIKQPAKDALLDVDEAEVVIVVVPWAMNLNYPPGTIITRGNQLSVGDLFHAKQQLMRMIEQIDQMVLKSISQPGRSDGPGQIQDAAAQP